MNYNVNGDSLLFFAFVALFGLAMLFVGWQVKGLLEERRNSRLRWP